MAIYKSLSELENNVLKEGDIVSFKTIWYLVVPNALVYFKRSVVLRNDKIFLHLRIRDKFEYCSMHYKYEASGNNKIKGQFPMSKFKDYEALTRLALGLMKLCERTN